MSHSIIYNNVVFNNLFAPKEFEFINHMDNSMEKIDAIIEKEKTNKNIITTFIDNLHNMLSSNNVEIDIETTNDLISEVKNILNLLNDNINVLENNKRTYDEIKKDILDLLIKTEAESNVRDDYKFSIELAELRANLNNFDNTIKKTKAQIFLNDIKVDNFFTKSIVKKYLLYCSSGIQNITNVSEEIESLESDTQKILNTSSDSLTTSESVLTESTNENNSILIISERDNKVYLPYSKKEVLAYLEQYPEHYKSFDEVVSQEFIFPLDFYIKHPIVARFRESYSLVRDRESKPILEALKFAIDIMFRYELNPAIIAACKSQDQLENYLSCIEHNKENEFTDFEIKFEVSPL